jgi:hypothetical protein
MVVFQAIMPGLGAGDADLGVAPLKLRGLHGQILCREPPDAAVQDLRVSEPTVVRLTGWPQFASRAVLPSWRDSDKGPHEGGRLHPDALPVSRLAAWF